MDTLFQLVNGVGGVPCDLVTEDCHAQVCIYCAFLSRGLELCRAHPAGAGVLRSLFKIREVEYLSLGQAVQERKARMRIPPSPGRLQCQQVLMLLKLCDCFFELILGV